MLDFGEADWIDGPLLGDECLRDGWRRLAVERENPFLTPEWYAAALSADPGAEPLAIAWRRGGELRGVLPLVGERRGPLRVLRFAGAILGDWFGPACRVEDEAEMAMACAVLLSRERSRWQLLEMTRLPLEGAWPEALWAGGAGAIARARRERLDSYPYIAFGEGGFDSWLAGRSRNFRSTLGRRRRKLEREHGLRFRLTESPDRLDEDMATFLRLHEERWGRRGGSGALAAGFQGVHSRFARAALERGWLRLWTAEVDGGPGASWYGWRIGDRYCYALSGMREEYEPLALGTVLLAHTIEMAAGEGASVYDLLRGDEGYKRRFQTDRREAGTWVLGRRRHPVFVAHAGKERLAAAARALPQPLRSPLKRVYGRAARR